MPLPPSPCEFARLGKRHAFGLTGEDADHLQGRDLGVAAGRRFARRRDGLTGFEGMQQHWVLPGKQRAGLGEVPHAGMVCFCTIEVVRCAIDWHFLP